MSNNSLFRKLKIEYKINRNQDNLYLTLSSFATKLQKVQTIMTCLLFFLYFYPLFINKILRKGSVFQLKPFQKYF